MGLSSYGDPKRFPQSMLHEAGGHIYVDPTRLRGRVSTNGDGADASTLLDHYGLSAEEARDARHNIERGVLADVAARLQEETEDRLVQLAQELYDETQCKQLCFAGGVALNSVANHKLLERTPFERIFVQPAAHDGGISLGLATGEDVVGQPGKPADALLRLADDALFASKRRGGNCVSVWESGDIGARAAS